jgi:SNF2 family DNA or RNA helicase
MDIYMEFRVLDGGATFGKNFFQFRAKYFYDKNSGMPAHVHFPNWQLKPMALEAFNSILHKRSAVARKEDCLTLPPLVRKRVEVALSPLQAKAYESMKKDFIAFFDKGASVAQLAITKALRLQQIVSGFVKMDDGAYFSFEDNPRIKALEGVLEEIFEAGQKVIIWSVFKENYAQIRRLLASMKVKYVELHGEVGEKQRQQNIDEFNAENDTMALVGHPGSGGIGANLTSASYSVYFSRGFSLEFDLQSQARNHRGGSERHKKITRIDLVAPETIDDLILERLSNKQAISDRVLGEIVEKLRG